MNFNFDPRSIGQIVFEMINGGPDVSLAGILFPHVALAFDVAAVSGF